MRGMATAICPKLGSKFDGLPWGRIWPIPLLGLWGIRRLPKKQPATIHRTAREPQLLILSSIHTLSIEPIFAVRAQNKASYFSCQVLAPSYCNRECSYDISHPVRLEQLTEQDLEGSNSTGWWHGRNKVPTTYVLSSVGDLSSNIRISCLRGGGLRMIFR